MKDVEDIFLVRAEGGCVFRYVAVEALAEFGDRLDL